MFLPFSKRQQCLATIATVYWRSNEESVEGDKQQKAPVLESRETVPPGSRADRVQGTFYHFVYLFTFGKLHLTSPIHYHTIIMLDREIL